MDDDRFDHLTRLLGTPGSRRAVLRALAAAAAIGLGSAAAAHGHAGSPEAAPARHKHRCPAGQTNCPRPTAAHDRQDQHAAPARHGAPRKICVDLQTDNANCGACGHACASDQTCQIGKCAGGGCTPKCQNKACGDDGCGGSCGACAGDQICQDGQCVCNGRSCPGGCCDGTTCQAGTTNGACGRNGQSCQPCLAPQTCGGGGAAQQCGCTPLARCPAGQNCGAAPDGCGGMLDCGSCTAPQTCGGGGTDDVCGCTPTTCQSGQCGQIDDGCGAKNDCGSCPSGQTCSGGQCVVAICQQPPCGCQGRTICDSAVSGEICPNGCYCAERVEGGSVCFDAEVFCHAGTEICTRDTDCGAGQSCVRKGSCAAASGCFGDANAGVCAVACTVMNTVSSTATRRAKRRLMVSVRD